MCRPPDPPCPRAPAALRRRFVRAPFRDRAVPVHRPDPIAHRRAPVHSRPDCRKIGTAAAKRGITEGIPVNPARAGDHARRGNQNAPRKDGLGSGAAGGCCITRPARDFRAGRGMGSDQSRRAVAGSDDRPGYPARGVDRNAASEVPAPAHGRRQSSDRPTDQAFALSHLIGRLPAVRSPGLGSKPARGCGIGRTAGQIGRAHV